MYILRVLLALLALQGSYRLHDSRKRNDLSSTSVKDYFGRINDY